MMTASLQVHRRQALPLLLSLTALAALCLPHRLNAELVRLRLGKHHASRVRYPALSARRSEVLHRETGVNESVTSISEEMYFNFEDSYPVFYPAPSQQGLVVCIPQKVGSTRWKNLFYRGRANKDAPDQGFTEGFSQLIHLVRAPWTNEPRYNSQAKVVAEILKPSAPRFMWVRNPYVRVLSGFLDKICSQHWQVRKGKWKAYAKWLVGGGKDFSCTPKEFYRYVKALVAARDAGYRLNPHFDVQANLCGRDHGMQYDYYLKVEEEDIWYPEFISLAGLEDAAQSHWSLETNSELHVNTKLDVPDCFLELPGMTCKETDAYIRKLGTGADAIGSHTPPYRAELREAQWMKGQNTKHAMGAMSKMHSFYATWDIVDLVTSYVRPDLIAFNYPVMELHGDDENKLRLGQ